MVQYRNFIRKELEDGSIVCEDVRLPSGTVCTVYISPNSVYVLSCGLSSPEERYSEIQQLLGAVRIRLYLLPSEHSATGLYDPLSNALTGEMDEDALAEDVESWLKDGRVIYAASARERMVSKLKSADIQARGYAVQENGDIFLLHKGTVRKASPVSSDLQYYLTLFFGPLGFHRFALGKIMSGLLYFFTGGLFLAGWFLDLLQLFLGMQTDKQKRYVLPLDNRKQKLLLLPFGLLVGFLLFQLYLKVSEWFGFGLQKLMVHQIQTTNPQAVEGWLESLTKLFSK